MSIRTFVPHTRKVATECVGIVLTNHVGSTVAQDTGRDAQALAEATGLAVIGVDRPGSGGWIPRPGLADRLSWPDGYVAETAKLGKRIDREADRLGLRAAALVGRSAGGLGALALAKSETVSNGTYLMVADPVACEHMSIGEGKERFRRYNALQHMILQGDLEEKPGDTQYIHPAATELPAWRALLRRARIPTAFLYDQFHNQSVWATDAAVRYARHIAAYQPTIDATIYFANPSLPVTPDVFRQDLAPLPNLRTSGQPFKVEQVPNTVHASFDNRQYFAELLRPTIDRALAAHGSQA